MKPSHKTLLPYTIILILIAFAGYYIYGNIDAFRRATTDY
jgi:hypothetical protein